jgi:hypothetical protein
VGWLGTSAESGGVPSTKLSSAAAVSDPPQLIDLPDIDASHDTGASEIGQS